MLRKPYAGKRLAVNVLKILSEDGGYSAVKEVADDKGRHYALKAMQKTDVHWENVTNEKKVLRTRPTEAVTENHTQQCHAGDAGIADARPPVSGWATGNRFRSGVSVHAT